MIQVRDCRARLATPSYVKKHATRAWFKCLAPDSTIARACCWQRPKLAPSRCPSGSVRALAVCPASASLRLRARVFPRSAQAGAIGSAERFHLRTFAVCLSVVPQFTDDRTIEASRTLIAQNAVERLQHVLRFAWFRPFSPSWLRLLSDNLRLCDTTWIIYTKQTKLVRPLAGTSVGFYGFG